MSCGFVSQSKLLNYYMSGIKLSCPIYYSHCCMCLFGKIVLKYCLFLFWYDLIFECKMILLGRAYQNILFGNLNISGKISYSRPSSFNTFVYQTSLFEKIVYQNWSILCDSLLNMCFCVHNIPYAICLRGDHNIPHLARECLVLVHLGPLHKESVHEHLLAVRSSGPDIYVHDFVQWSNKLHIWYQMNFIWCKNCFLKAYLQIYFLHVL